MSGPFFFAAQRGLVEKFKTFRELRLPTPFAPFV
jgi:hypothetical protein